MAKRFETTLIAIHVIDPRYNHLETALSPRPGKLKEILIFAKEEAYQHLDKAKQNATKNNFGVKTDIIVGKSSTVKAIVEYPEKNKINMIVIGSRVPLDLKECSWAALLVA